MFEHRRDLIADPFFSVCIPQFNRTSFLMEALRSLVQQTCREFEVCISDDCSTDGRHDDLVDFLNLCGLSFVYRVQPRNVRYDANLRTSISMARGRYCFLLGNDDALADERALEEYRRALAATPSVGVATSNFVEATSGAVVRRVQGTRVLPGGPATAARVYRNFSFVSGVVLKRNRAQHHATNRWDGAEMYQTYLASRIISEGGAVLCLDRVVICMAIQVPGESVDSVIGRPRLYPCPIVERRQTLTDMGRLVADALQPYAPVAVWQRQVEWVVAQLYLFPYMYWLFTYRRVQSWNFSAGVCLGMRPRNVLADVRLPRTARIRLALVYLVASLCGLLVPLRAFEALKSSMWRLAKSLT